MLRLIVRCLSKTVTATSTHNFFFFFFSSRRRHTRFDCDWSSDVCSSDLCPLTPLENALRRRAGLAGYAGGFVEHYVLPVLYPAGLTRPTQALLGTLVVVVNLIAYGVLLRRALRGG